MSVYVPPAAANPGSICSGSCQTENDLKYYWIGQYLNAHMLSIPSHRYAYLLWFVIIGVLLIASAIYHAGIGDQTWIGAYWTKFAPKGRLIKIGRKAKKRKGKPLAPSSKLTPGAKMEKPPRRYIFSIPSFGKMLLISWMVAVPVVLSVVGADYINPNVSMFDLAASWPPGNSAPKISRRGLLQKRVLWGIGNYVPLGTNVAYYTLPYHTWWTSGGRTGLMTNALTPFVVILALKQVPWAVMSTRLFGRHSFEKMSFLHKWGGRLLWTFAAAHTILWSIQLRLDRRNGQIAWEFIFLWPKFRWAFVAMGFLTLLTILSIGPIRTNYYEFFYLSHIVCGVGFMVATAFHHPPLAPWMWASLGWWGLERITRALKVAYVNGIGFAGRKPKAAAFQPNTSQSMDANYNGGVWKDRQHVYSQGAPPLSNHQTRYPMNSRHPGAGDHPHFRPATFDSSAQHTQSSATLYESSVASNATRWGPLKVPPAQHYSPEKAGSLDPDYSRGGNDGSGFNSGTGEDDEWDVDEDGDKVSKRPSRRYGPVSDLIKEYAARPASDLQEDHRSRHNVHSGRDVGSGFSDPLRSSSTHDESTDLGSQLCYEEMPLRSMGQAIHGAPDPSAYESGPASSADHYYSEHAYPRGHGGNGQHGYDVSQRAVPPAPYRSMPPTPPIPRAPRPALPADVAAIIKPGFAFAQVLPGKTLRLTLRTPNKMSWKPGQWVYLNLPSISGWQSHPFTIASAHDAHLPLSTSDRRNSDRPSELEKGLTKAEVCNGDERTMVLLVRVRKGFTLKLWEYVKKHRQRQVMAASQFGGSFHSTAVGKTTTGVHLRAIVDGAYGSTERVRWGVHSTVIIVCGGSGVSFGISVLEHLCACIHEVNLTGKTIRGGKNFKVQRVRFVWICREFSHLQWIASALRRCIELIPPAQLQVDLYVTHINNQIAQSRQQRNARSMVGPQGRSLSGDARPANGRFPLSSMQSSFSHNGTDTSYGGAESPYDAGSAMPSGGEPDTWRDAQGNTYVQPSYVGGQEAENMGMEPNEFTEFDEDDLAEPDEAEMAINTRIRDEGKLRRAHTRKVTLKRKGGRGASQPREGGPDTAGALQGRDSWTIAAQNAMYNGSVHATPFLRNMQDQQQRQPRGASYDVQTSRGRSPHQGAAAMRGPADRSYQTAQGHLEAQQSYGSTPPGSRPYTPTSFPPGMEGYRRDLSPSTQDHTGGEWSDPAFQTPFGNNTFDSFARRSSAHLLAGDPMGEDELLPSGSGGEGLENAIDLDEEEELDLRIIAELAHMGHPRLEQVLSDETYYSKGRTLVASCGPSNLSNLLRRIAVKHVDPARSRKGDKRGEVNLCMESFDWGGS